MKQTLAFALAAAAALSAGTAFAQYAIPSAHSGSSLAGGTPSDPDPLLAAASGNGSSQTPSADWSLTPMWPGGATASISGIDPARGFAFAVDGYYTPYGDDMKGGGFSMIVEGELLGGRMTFAHTSGEKENVEMSMDYLAVDLYLRRAVVENVYAYAGIGFALLNFDTEQMVHRRYYYGHHQLREYDDKDEWGGESDPIFTCYAGMRWRFLNPVYAFAEYRYDADAKIDVGREEKMELEGGDRFVVGAGLMF